MAELPKEGSGHLAEAEAIPAIRGDRGALPAIWAEPPEAARRTAESRSG